MAKVFNITSLELKPGVTEEDFESFLKEESTLGFFSDTNSIGWYSHVVKGIRGDRDGKNLILTEVESVESLDRFHPDDGEVTEDIKQWLETHPDVGNFWKKIKNLTDFEGINTVYIELD